MLPTNTWQTYNFQDVDGNGYGDTWYAGPPNGSVNLSKPYIARGAPPRFYRYDLPFLHWLFWSGKTAEFISDSDFDQIANGDALAKAYDLVVYEGHTEYVTAHEYDVVQRYRDLGGNLMFLSANNFFWKVTRKGQVLRRVQMWRKLGRPEAALVGVQWAAGNQGQGEKQYVVDSDGYSKEQPLFAGTGLGPGSSFGGSGVEIDARAPSSPASVVVLARIPHAIGAHDAEMTIYGPGRPQVFAAGTLDFTASMGSSAVARLVENVWDALAAPR